MPKRTGIVSLGNTTTRSRKGIFKIERECMSKIIKELKEE